MFSTHIFKTWPAILAGALLFGTLFMLVGMMSALVLDGILRPTRTAVSLGALAFVGYIVVALLFKTFPGLADGE